MLSLLIRPAVTASTLLAALPAPPGAAPKDEIGPPGLVSLRGGTTHVGSTKKDIEDLLETVSGAQNALRALDAETPQNRVSVQPFLLGLNELTNEQYAVFIRATGHRPPQEWGGKALQAATLEFLTQQAKENEERKKRGERVVRESFDGARWWSEHWSESEWAIPEGAALKPVTFVDYSDALAYCKWAGVRLPTELEYQHACRGDSKRPYPWGEEWEDGKYAATNELRGRDTCFPIASFEAGVSEDGIFELSGNVWEWTSSPYVAYEKFEKNTYKVGKQEMTPEPDWDANKRVAVGGSFQNSRLVARCTTRRPSERTQMTNALGFRIAATPKAGVDIANAVYGTEVRNSDARPSGVVYLPAQAIAMDRWEEAEASDDAPSGYGVIGGYEYVVFVPIEELEETQDGGFRRLTLVAPQHLGFLSTTVPSVEPALAAGTYLVAFRAKGETQLPEVEGEEDAGGQEGEEQPKPEPVEDPLAGLIDIEQDNLLFFDAKTGELAAHLPATDVAFGTGEGGGSFEPVVEKIWVQDPNDPKEKIQVEDKRLRLAARIATKIRRRILPLQFTLKPEAEVFEKSWRK